MRGLRPRTGAVGGPLFLAFLFVGLASAAFGKGPPLGVKSASKTVVETVASAKDLKTLYSLIQVSGLVDTLSSPGPYTVFAPTDEAFKKLPEGAVDNLMKRENKPQLQTVLTYHVVQGTMTVRDLLEKIKEGGGKAQLKTVQGEVLTADVKGRAIEIIDAKGGNAIVTIANQMQANGVIHVVNAVLLP